MKTFIVICMLAFFVVAPTSALTVQNQHHKYQTPICHNENGILVPMSGSCTGFFICTNGNAVASSCGDFYHFNARTRLCDHPRRAECNPYKTFEYNENEIVYTTASAAAVASPPISTQIAPHISIPTPKHPDEVVADIVAGSICQQQLTGVLLPKSDTCSQYYVCILQRPYKRTCPLRMHFNAARKLCQDPALAQCKAKITYPSVIPQAYGEAKTKDEEREVSGICAGIVDNTIRPHPSDCGKFVACNRRNAKEMKCPDGLYFSVKHQRCEWPWLANCTN